MKKAFWVIVLIGVVVSGGCGTTTRVSDESIERIEYERLQELLASPKERVVVVDVRTEDRFMKGHIPGAINIPLPSLRVDDPRLLDSTAIVVYAGTWRDNLSAAAAKRLLTLGYDDVYDFRAGWEQWQDAAGPRPRD